MFRNLRDFLRPSCSPLPSPSPAPHWQAGVFFLPRESVGIGTLVLWGAVCCTVTPNGDRVSALHSVQSVPRAATGTRQGTPLAALPANPPPHMGTGGLSCSTKQSGLTQFSPCSCRW